MGMAGAADKLRPMPLPEMPWFGSAPKGQRYLAGISGGADSMALLHLLHERDFRDVVVCHLNHGLRGADADGDASFVTGLAERLGYPCEIGHAGGLAQTSGQSLETAARHARHAFFADCSRKHDCYLVLLAHHRDDQAETILWNLLRGSRGLSGMKESQRLEISGTSLELLRPLLDVSRAELRAWLGERAFTWREDTTNAEPFTARNRLRNEALPLLEEIARRDVADSLTRASEATQELTQIQAWAVEHAGAIDPQGRLHVPTLLTLPSALQAACIHEYLRQAKVPDLSREVVRRCLSVLEPGDAHVVNLPGGFAFRRRQGRCFVETSPASF
jgi:tRNA(Ile)-lysidine synthase